jgi:hypothetical protein
VQFFIRVPGREHDNIRAFFISFFNQLLFLTANAFSAEILSKEAFDKVHTQYTKIGTISSTVAEMCSFLSVFPEESTITSAPFSSAFLISSSRASLLR